MKITIKDNKIFLSGTLGNYCFSTTKDGKICVKRRPAKRKSPFSPAEIANHQRFAEQAKAGILREKYYLKKREREFEQKVARQNQILQQSEVIHQTIVRYENEI